MSSFSFVSCGHTLIHGQVAWEYGLIKKNQGWANNSTERDSCSNCSEQRLSPPVKTFLHRIDWILHRPRQSSYQLKQCELSQKWRLTLGTTAFRVFEPNTQNVHIILSFQSMDMQAFKITHWQPIGKSNIWLDLKQEYKFWLDRSARGNYWCL